MDFRRKRKNSNSASSNLDLPSRTKAEKLFQKKASYAKGKDLQWDLPSATAISSSCSAWTVPELLNLKQKLNNLKDKLSDKEISEWHSHTQFMNFAGNIVQEVRQQIHPELCTQAWCKFYEILSAHDLVDSDSANFNSVHLCEAPGAFITSLNHFLISQDYRGTWTWYANTLNPWYEGNSVGEMIDDDHFIRDTVDYWYFGPDNTGNIMDLRNLRCLVEKCQEMGNIHLVTADGSIDCQDDPAEQELVVSRLHICEALTALSILTPGGHMVLKKFTMFECDTVCLLYILNCVFSEVHIMKPSSSKSGNSEVYIVCKDFLAPDGHKELIERLCELYFDSGTNLSAPPRCIFAKEKIPTSFLNQHIDICTLFTNLQGETIQNNLDHYPLISEQYRVWIQSVKEYCAEYYFSLYNVQPISDHCRVVPFRSQKKIKKINGFNKKGNKFRDKKSRTGTFNDRQMLARLPWEQRVQQMEKLEISLTHPVWFKKRLELDEYTLDPRGLTTGACPDFIRSSKFCDNIRIQEMNDIFTNTVMEKEVTVEQYSHGVNNVLSYLTSGTCSDKLDIMLVVKRFNTDSDRRKILHLCPEVSQLICSDQIVPADTPTKAMYIVDGLVNPSSCCYPGQEVASQAYLTTTLNNNLMGLHVGDTIVILISTCLTRFTAGVIYLLTACFSQLTILPMSTGWSLQQFLVCQDFTGCPDAISNHLHSLSVRLDRSDLESTTYPLEVVPSYILFSDSEFVSFLRDHNEALVKSFVNTVIDMMKSSSTVR